MFCEEGEIDAMGLDEDCRDRVQHLIAGRVSDIIAKRQDSVTKSLWGDRTEVVQDAEARKSCADHT